MRIRVWLLAHLPAGVIARPAEWFLAILLTLSGVTILAGLSDPPSIAALLAPVVYYGWGACMAIGGIAMISGLASARWVSGTDRYIITRVAVYVLGLRLLGLSSLAYALAILFVGGWNGLPAACITLSFTAMCGVRLLTIGSGR